MASHALNYSWAYAVAKFGDNWYGQLEKRKLKRYLRAYGKDSLSKSRNLRFPLSNVFFNMTDLSLELFAKPFLVVLAIALPAVYGGVHLSAWNFEFPTPEEHLLWKITCFIIAGAAVVLVSVALMIFVVGPSIGSEVDYYTGFGDGDEKPLTIILWVIYEITGAVILVLYVCARLYIVVESFLSLRRVPIGLYYTPSWLQMIPHI